MAIVNAVVNDRVIVKVEMTSEECWESDVELRRTPYKSNELYCRYQLLLKSYV
jgi:hypothetical protein